MSVGNIFDGYYTDPYGAGTPPGGRASGDIWSGVYDYGDYDYGGGTPRPAPPKKSGVVSIAFAAPRLGRSIRQRRAADDPRPPP